MLTARKIQKGVTLIELMIGMAIFAMLLALAVPNFSTFIQNSKIRTAAEAIQNGLSLARVEAVRRNVDVQFVLGANTAWTVGCATEVVGSCPAFIQGKPASADSSGVEIGTGEVVASTNILAAVPVFDKTLTFNGFGRLTPASLPAGNNAIFDIINPAGGACASLNGPMRCLRVEVTSGGQVRMCDPKLPATDPQSC